MTRLNRVNAEIPVPEATTGKSPGTLSNSMRINTELKSLKIVLFVFDVRPLMLMANL